MLATMKRILALCALTTLAAVASAQVVRVEVNGVLASYDGTPPQIRKGRVLVPVRGTLDQMQVEMNWDQVMRVFTAEKEGLKVTLKVGDRFAYRNGDPVELDVPAQVIEGRTMVPLRFLSECFGASVGWNGLEQLVSITTGNPSFAPASTFLLCNQVTSRAGKSLMIF